MYGIKVKKQGEPDQELVIKPNENLLQALISAGIFITAPCGGNGLCGKCKIKLLPFGSIQLPPYHQNEMTNLTEKQRLSGYRLACQIRVDRDLCVEVENEDLKPHILTSAKEDLEIDPLVKRVSFAVEPPSLADQRADLKRLEEALFPYTVNDLDLISLLPEVLRFQDYKGQAILVKDSVFSIEEEKDTHPLYGLAIDIGTTTIAAYFMNLSTGQEVGVLSALNPQQVYGNDVISRIDFTLNEPEGLMILRDLIRQTLNQLIIEGQEKYGISGDHIYHLIIVGNTIMTHLLAGLPVKNIALSPFIPVITRQINLPAQELGFPINPRAVVTFLPSVSAFVGSDTIAAILACRMAEDKEINLLVDIGTNGEIALGNKEQILVSSVAAGPAFEGAKISQGMAALDGAINQVRINEDLTYTTLGGKAARGICGSGVIELTAELIKSKLVDRSGRMLSPEEKITKIPESLARRIREFQGQPAILVAGINEGVKEEILFTQKDLREVQLAKAAIAAGISSLMKIRKVSYQDIKHVFLAGGFGNFLDPSCTAQIGLIPQELKDKITFIGNGAGTGGKMALLSKKWLAKAEEMPTKITHLELSANSGFQAEFLEQIGFKAIPD
jgi:uncharacterized 2Fe-2S/4Fe-4S cluster protein (DUF4445 family)